MLKTTAWILCVMLMSAGFAGEGYWEQLNGYPTNNDLIAKRIMVLK